MDDSFKLWLAEFSQVPEFASTGENTGEGVVDTLGIALAAYDDKARKKQDVLDRFHQLVDQQKKEIRDIFAQISLQKKDAHFFSSKKKLLAAEAGKTQMDEIDFSEIDLSKVDPETSEKLGIVSNRMQKIISTELTPEIKELFTKDELREEFWTPLVRERILPETLVADSLSETNLVLKESFKAYQDASKAKEEAGEKDSIGWVGLGLSSGFSMIATGTSAGMGGSEIGKNWDKAKKLKSSEATNWFFTGRIEPGKKTMGISSEVMVPLKTGALVIKDTVDMGLTDSYAGIFERKEVKTANTRQLASLIVNLLDQQLLSLLAQVNRLLTDGSNDPKKDEEIISFVNAVTKSSWNRSGILSQILSALDEVEDDDGVIAAKKVTKILNENLGKFSSKIKNEAGVEINFTQFIADVEEIKIKKYEGIYFFAKEFVKVVETLKPDIVTLTNAALLKGQDRDGVKTKNSGLAAELKRSWEAGMQEEAKGKFSVVSLETLITEMEEDNAKVEQIFQIVGGCASIVGEVIPIASAFATGAELVQEGMAAHKRRKQWEIWRKNKTAFANAQSALSATAQNFVHNQGQQFVHHTAKAIFDAVKMLGEIVAAIPTGVSTVIGKVGVMAAEVLSTLEEVIYDTTRTAELQVGWNRTKEYMRNPDNRKKGLEALQKNPTLAKYSIAWAALTMKDGLAIHALNECNLTPDMLRENEGKLDLVVKYLETLYSEDKTLYRVVRTSANWLPKEPELTVKGWRAFTFGMRKTTKELKYPDLLKEEQKELPIAKTESLLLQFENALEKKNVDSAKKLAGELTNMLGGCRLPSYTKCEAKDAWNATIAVLQGQAQKIISEGLPQPKAVTEPTGNNLDKGIVQKMLTVINGVVAKLDWHEFKKSADKSLLHLLKKKNDELPTMKDVLGTKGENFSKELDSMKKSLLSLESIGVQNLTKSILNANVLIVNTILEILEAYVEKLEATEAAKAAKMAKVAEMRSQFIVFLTGISETLGALSEQCEL
jgi:hypothetical protein